MKKISTGRREFLKALIALPGWFVLACNGEERQETGVHIDSRSSEEAIKKLVILLGPWSASEKEEAENFANRFIAASNNTNPYLPKSGELIQSVASRLSTRSGNLNEIDLKEFPGEERQLLIQFVQQLYSYLELRNRICKEPQFGECQIDKIFYTRALI